jgi:glutamate N-acetyltransferase/amino-acid N-acetyltransferase
MPAHRGSPIIRSARGGVTEAKGFSAAGVKAGIKASGAADLALLVSDTPCAAAGAFTTNKVRASCVDWNAENLPSGKIRAVLCNSGCANACTGKPGRQDTEYIAQIAGQYVGGAPESVLVAATGVIGHRLPMDRVVGGLEKAYASLSPDGGALYSRAIMTTDTKPKEAAVRVNAGRAAYAIGGCCKGAGMICPNMATMLAFVTSDAKIAPKALNAIVKRVVDGTFNNLTIDGDTSTNDMVLVLANGASGVAVTSPKDLKLFEEALFTVCDALCAKIAEDGEGATKRVEIRVSGGRTARDAKLAARSIANSNLVKTALFGNDPNWGRILCAIGYSGADFSQDKMLVKLCGRLVCKGTTPQSFPVDAVRKAMAKKVMLIEVDLAQGAHAAIAHTCDFSYEYVKINAEYHT